MYASWRPRPVGAAPLSTKTMLQQAALSVSAPSSATRTPCDVWGASRKLRGNTRSNRPHERGSVPLGKKRCSPSSRRSQSERYTVASATLSPSFDTLIDALPVALCEAPKTFVAPVFNEAKDPAPCFHCRSAAPLLARPPFVPVHVAACEATVKFHGRLDLTVAVGPASSWNPASNAASTGLVRVVVAEFSVSRMTLGTLTDAALFT